MGAATCQVLKGGIIHLDSVGGAIAFQKIRDKKGKLVDTLAFTNEDEIALDYKLIQDTYGADCYNIYLRQETLKTGGPIGHKEEDPPSILSEAESNPQLRQMLAA